MPFRSSLIIRTHPFRNFGLVCENKSNRTVRLSSNFQGSKNVLSSRHAFQMIDTIPAKTQQLIAIFTRKMFSNDVQIGKTACVGFELDSLPIDFFQHTK